MTHDKLTEARVEAIAKAISPNAFDYESANNKADHPEFVNGMRFIREQVLRDARKYVAADPLTSLAEGMYRVLNNIFLSKSLPVELAEDIVEGKFLLARYRGEA